MTNWNKRSVVLAIGAIAALGQVGCDDDEGTTDQDPIELVGTWGTGFGDETITATRWDGFCQQVIERYDNATNVAVLETVSGTDCVLGFSRVVWLEPVGSSFYYCTTAFSQETAAGAAATPEQGVDRANTDTGCAGFPWSKLTRK